MGLPFQESLTHLLRSFTPGSLTMHSCTHHGASTMVGVISPECACISMLHRAMEPDPSTMLNSILRQSHHQWPHNSDAQPGLQPYVLHTNLCCALQADLLTGGPGETSARLPQYSKA